ncbi:MAG: DUF2442 domain-containing protein [Calditrichia bacterium]|nr:DUF2442 domain-containing protein [Calditrichia bacterium]
MRFIDLTSQTTSNSIFEIKDANYLGDFALRVKFSDGTEKLIDFKPFLSKSQHPSIKKYLNEVNFKSFKIVEGNLNWNDYDLIFPISDLYRGYIQ